MAGGASRPKAAVTVKVRTDMNQTQVGLFVLAAALIVTIGAVVLAVLTGQAPVVLQWLMTTATGLFSAAFMAFQLNKPKPDTTQPPTPQV